jgi:hypothetical protein
MKEKLPIWLQAFSVILLSVAHLLAVAWVWGQEQAEPTNTARYGIEAATRGTLYLAIPALILFLGVRLLVHVLLALSLKARLARREMILYCLAVVFLVPPSIALASWAFLPKAQRNGGGGSLLASEVGLRRDR